jgi:hypothetical protein
VSGSLSTYLETALLNHVFGGPTYLPPSALFVALFTTIPTPDGGGTEVPPGGGYSRLPVIFSAASGSPPTMNNPAAIQWPVASVSWGTLTAGGVFDGPTAGNMLGSARLVSAVDGITPATLTVEPGMIFRLPPLGLVIGFIMPPMAPVPFVGPPTARRPVMRPMRGEVIDGSGVARLGVVMAPRP